MSDPYFALGKDPRYELAANLGGMFGGLNGAINMVVASTICDIQSGQFPPNLSIMLYFDRYYGDQHLTRRTRRTGIFK